MIPEGFKCFSKLPVLYSMSDLYANLSTSILKENNFLEDIWNP